MKKLILAAPAACLCFLLACNTGDAGKESNGQSNAAMYRETNAKIYRAIESGDVAVLDSILADDAVDHGDPSGRDVKGKDSIKASLAQVHNMFSDLHFEVMNSATDGDVSLERVRMTGTCTMDMPAMGMVKGKKVDMTTVEVTRYSNGKAAEHWTFMNQQELMQAIGEPADHTMPMKDSSATKK